jgi:hypothetical protein
MFVLILRVYDDAGVLNLLNIPIFCGQYQVVREYREDKYLLRKQLM